MSGLPRVTMITPERMDSPLAENATYAALDQYIDRLITESTPDYTVWNVEKIRQGAPTNWNYVDGCMMTALLSLYESGVRQVLLGHLSKENNTPELALQTASERLSREGVRLNEDIYLGLAWRDRVSRKFEIE